MPDVNEVPLPTFIINWRYHIGFVAGATTFAVIREFGFCAGVLSAFAFLVIRDIIAAKTGKQTNA